ncbi:hypothetical protein CVT24_001395 [Panaeolus cyanescens]|uniref:Ribonuclease H1 N-terminal domain-containing protein n=1 Tax=Panaeolus cyanescens TaxID=181874 RepID=A0A409YU30_9AGAR|nr:hypothetical protein CVT24_001395 [Panaeolus cyanescens]
MRDQQAQPSPTSPTRRQLSAWDFLWRGPSPKSPGQIYEAYCVWEGTKVGIFTSWTDARHSLSPAGKRCKGFDTIDEAVERFQKELDKRSELYIAALEQHLQMQAPSATPRQSISVASLYEGLPVSPPTTPRRPAAASHQPRQNTPLTLSQRSVDAEDDDRYYIVESGALPGVYQGRLKAWKAAGPDLHAVRYPVESEEQAWKTFGLLYMANRIHTL